MPSSLRPGDIVRLSSPCESHGVRIPQDHLLEVAGVSANFDKTVFVQFGTATYLVHEDQLVLVHRPDAPAPCLRDYQGKVVQCITLHEPEPHLHQVAILFTDGTDLIVTGEPMVSITSTGAVQGKPAKLDVIAGEVYKTHA